MHIGIISDKRKKRSERPYVIHNNRYFPGVFPGKTAEQDILLGPKLAGVSVRSWKVVGHFRLSQPLEGTQDNVRSPGSFSGQGTGADQRDSAAVLVPNSGINSAE
jgi:hypothetical protein